MKAIAMAMSMAMSMAMLGYLGLMLGGCAQITTLPTCHGAARPINSPMTTPTHE